jgi:hypothetical protein
MATPRQATPPQSLPTQPPRLAAHVVGPTTPRPPALLHLPDMRRHDPAATTDNHPTGGVMDLAYRILLIVFVFLAIIIELAVLGLLGVNLHPL